MAASSSSAAPAPPGGQAARRRLLRKQSDSAAPPLVGSALVAVPADAAGDALVAVAAEAAGDALVPVRPQRPKACCAWTNGYTLGVYTVLGAQYESMEAALEACGTRKRCTGHAARIGKRVGGNVFLKCRLDVAEPPCKWMALLRLQPDGSVHEMLGGKRSASVKLSKVWDGGRWG